MMRSTMVTWTWSTLPSLRFRFELLLDARCRRPGLRRRILPFAVTLNRFATDFFVLRRAMDLGMGRGRVAAKVWLATSFYKEAGLEGLECAWRRLRLKFYASSHYFQ